MASNSKKSVAWRFFEVDEKDEFKAVCQLCQMKVSRGTKPLHMTTTNMLKHISLKHPNEEEGKDKKGAKIEGKKKKHKLDLCIDWTKKRKFNQTKTSTFKKARSKPMIIMEIEKQNILDIHETSTSKTATLQPISIMETIEKQKVLDINDSRSKNIHKLIGEMIAIDLHPFSIVEDIGFQRLLKKTCPNYKIPSIKYFKETVIQDIYSKVRNNIQNELNNVQFVSFTINGSNATTSDVSFISVTGHWITEKFKQRTAVLRVIPFTTSYTAENISNCLEDTIKEFNISNHKVHVFVRDNAANMVAGVEQTGYDSLPCFLHCLQLVLNDVIFEQQYVKDIMEVIKDLSGHFKHSPAMFQEDDQKNFNLQTHNFIQDVSTHWNSPYSMMESSYSMMESLYNMLESPYNMMENPYNMLESPYNMLERLYNMMERMLEHKNELISYCSYQTNLPCLDGNQWRTLKKLAQILKIFVDSSNFIKERNALASSIIPNTKVICKVFEKAEENGLFRGLGSILTAWKSSVSFRFSSYNNNKNLIMATYLDPRYKLNFLNDKQEEKLHQYLLEDINLINENKTILDSSHLHLSVDIKMDTEDKNTDFDLTFDQCMQEILTMSEEEHQNLGMSSTSRSELDKNENPLENEIKLEMSKYKEIERIGQDENPLCWWDSKQKNFPNLSVVSKKYLCAPPSLVEIENLFNEGGTLYSPKRNRMEADTEETLMFLHHNLLMTGLNYE